MSLNIRPYTDQLRRVFGKTSFVRMFDTVAGGGGRHVRLGMLFGSIDREVDCRRDLAAQGDRWVQIDLDETGHGAWHFRVTADCPCDPIQGPWRMQANTLATSFTTPQEMVEAIHHELTRCDHPELITSSTAPPK